MIFARTKLESGKRFVDSLDSGLVAVGFGDAFGCCLRGQDDTICS